MTNRRRVFRTVVLKGLVTCSVAAILVAAVHYGSSARVRPGEAIVRGTLLLGEQPAARMHMRFVLQEGRVFEEVVTDGRGRFALSRPGPLEEYGIVIGAMPHLHSTTRFVTATAVTNATISLPPTHVRVKLVDDGGKAVDAAVQLLVRGPSSPTQFQTLGFINEGDKGDARFAGLGYGDYVITAFTPDGLVSAAPARMSLSAESPRADAALVLSRRPLRLTIADDRGVRLRGAQIRSGYKVLEESPDGTYDAAEVPPGQEILVSAQGWLPTCRTITRFDLREAVIRLRPFGAFKARFSLVNAPERPVGLLDGIDGSDCSIPVEAFSIRNLESAEPGQIEFELDGLPRGRFGYRAQEQAPLAVLEVPGKLLSYVIPQTCRFC